MNKLTYTLPLLFALFIPSCMVEATPAYYAEPPDGTLYEGNGTYYHDYTTDGGVTYRYYYYYQPNRGYYLHHRYIVPQQVPRVVPRQQVPRVVPRRR